VPDFNILRILNDADNRHTEATLKRVTAVIGELESMTPEPEARMPSLMTKVEGWIRERRTRTLLRRIISASEDGPGTDPRLLTAELQAAYDWRLDATQTGRYAFQSREDLLRSTTVPFLVQKLIVQNSLVALVSPPGCNKTFLALDLALSIASAQPTWLGRTLHLSGPVVYVLGEGGGRFKLRVQAWEQEHGVTSSYPFHTVNEAVALTNTADSSPFVREVAGLKPVLIVFDTLSRCLAGADENNQKDMSAAVGVCDRLRRQLGCSVLLLHHTTKDGQTERGSSVLRGAVDTLLRKPDTSDRHFMLTCDKQKDAEPFDSIGLFREDVTLAAERDVYTGEPAMSCVVKVEPTSTRLQLADTRLKAARLHGPLSGASRNRLAEHLRGRRDDRLQEIADWELRGELQFRQSKRQSSPLASLKAEVAADAIH
jgi:hypothetical protein